jgi:hypothetical protein
VSYITSGGTSFDPIAMDDDDLVHFHSPSISSISAVSFTTSTTQKWRDHKLIPGSETLHVIPPPPFIVNHNHLERSPESQEENFEVASDRILSSSPKHLKSKKHQNMPETKETHSAKSNHKLPQSVQRRTTGTEHRDGEKGSLHWEHGYKQNGEVQEQEHRVGKRSAGTGVGGSVLMLVNVTLLQYLDTGRWFLSVYNDDLRPHQVTLVVAEAEGVSTACPNDCSGHGSCYLGKCDCIDGYEGIDCSKSEYLIPLCL